MQEAPIQWDRIMPEFGLSMNAWLKPMNVANKYPEHARIRSYQVRSAGQLRDVLSSPTELIVQEVTLNPKASTVATHSSSDAPAAKFNRRRFIQPPFLPHRRRNNDYLPPFVSPRRRGHPCQSDKE